VIFHSYVSLPEGQGFHKIAAQRTPPDGPPNIWPSREGAAGRPHDMSSTAHSPVNIWVPEMIT
jgi:hypothetical protein